MQAVAISDEERRCERLSEPSLSRALAAMRDDGAVVLENAVDPAHLDRLREHMTRDSRTLLRGAAVAPALFWSAAGRRRGHLQQSVPRDPELVFRDVLANPWASQITRALLGAGAFFGIPRYSCNVNCPGSEAQAVHYDPAPPGAIAVNICLDDAGEHNGAIELWLGTHERDAESPEIPRAMLERARETRPPIRGVTRKGSVLLRWLRLWHRGMPNHSQRLRHMLVTLHYPLAALEHPQLFYQCAFFPSATKPVFARAPLTPLVRFGNPRRVPHLLDGPAYELAEHVRALRVVGMARRLYERIPLRS